MFQRGLAVFFPAILEVVLVLYSWEGEGERCYTVACGEI